MIYTKPAVLTADKSLKRESIVMVVHPDEVAKLPDRSAFAGSVATADRLIRTMVNLADVSIVNAVKMATASPAKLLGIFERKGSIAVGKDADIIIFDDDINIARVIVGGRVCV